VEVETGRLLLREWSKDDLDELAAIFAEPAVWHFPFKRGLTRQETERFLDRQIAHWETHGFGCWAVEVKGDGHLAGYIGLSIPEWLPQVLPAVEVGWRLHHRIWGRGLATEGGRASLGHGFDQLGLERIIAIVMPDNAASLRVAAKLGMGVVMETRDAVREVPLQVHEITKDEWERSG
jgi:RimJ/RimL family protein N-acetyltransferase